MSLEAVFEAQSSGARHDEVIANGRKNQQRGGLLISVIPQSPKNVAEVQR
ncbi:MAG: hypothetical protein OHK0046_37290 [Anaerolineae bacterium]